MRLKRTVYGRFGTGLGPFWAGTRENEHFKIGIICFKKGKHSAIAMPEEAIAYDPMSYRYYDYPMPGSIFRLPDIPMLVRGKTYVKLPSGRDIEVDPEFKREQPVPAAVHEQGQAGNSLQDLLKQLTGKRTEGSRALRPQHPDAFCLLEEPLFGAVDEKGEPLPHWLKITRCHHDFVKER